MKNDEYININRIAEVKGLKSNRSLRIAINKGKYIAREIQVNGGKSYEILYSSLEFDVQQKLELAEIKSTALIPVQNNPRINYVSEKAKLTSLARVDIIAAFNNFRYKYRTKKEAETVFIDLYNSGLYLPKIHKFMGDISIGTLKRWVKAYEEGGTNALIPQHKCSQQSEYNSILTKEMKDIFLKFLLNPNKFKIGTAINLTRHILEKNGYENIPCALSFRRFAEHYKNNNFAKWTFIREGEKAYHDNVEQYLERNNSLLNVGDVLVADGHVLNFHVIDPFEGKPVRATLVGFLDWKSTALVGFEIMLTENTQCIASALRNAIINLGVIPKVVYQDNGKAFKAKYFQKSDFDQEGFNGVYSNLGIKSVFAKPYNARAKVIERFFRDFQESFEKMMITYCGTSIEDKPAWMKRGEKLHKKMHEKLTGGRGLTIPQVSAYINCWLDYYNSKPCPNDKNMTIKECLNSVQKQDININILNDMMMKSEPRQVNRNGITFMGMHYRDELLMDIRDKVYIRYSLFDLSKVHVYSLKGEFLCVAHRVTPVHPMAYHLGTVKDIEEYNHQIRKQKRQFNKVKKDFIKYFPSMESEIIDVVPEEPILEIEQFEQIKPTRERKLRRRAEAGEACVEQDSECRLMRVPKQTEREQQMNKPMFISDYEKYEWLMAHGCTNPEDRKWLADYIRSDEYNDLYGGEE